VSVDPANPLTQYFPANPYNFDVTPTEYAPTGLGPLHAVIEALAGAITNYVSAVNAFKVQTTIQTATGIYLDASGVLYGVQRLPGEPDSAYRIRILDALDSGKLTLGAIQTAVQKYLNSLASVDGGVAPVAYVYDLLSDPTSCAADAAAGETILILQFVVQVTSQVSEDDIFFLDYAYLDYNTYLWTAGTTYATGGIDPGLEAVVYAIKAAGTQPVYKYVVTIIT
jgi:hypothetical protein